MSIKGLKVGEVSLEKYNPMWKEEFLKEKENLEKIMGKIALSIEHVGSTAIEGLSAKPIIDIAVGVEKLSDFEKVRHKFLNHAQYSIKNPSSPGEVLVRKVPEENRTHFIHVMEINSERYIDTLKFRDYIINNKEALFQYEKLKQELAKKYPSEREKYTSSKNYFITDILNKK